MKLLSSKFITLLLVIFVITACSSNEQTEGTPETNEEISSYVNNELLVSVEWLKENVNSEGILILDARGEEEYAKGHIPGSMPVSWQQFSKMDGGPGEVDWGVVLDAPQLSERLSTIGVSSDKTIVVYGNPNSWGEDGRVIWMLQTAGIQAKMLNGGWTAWEATEEVSKESTVPEASNFNVEELDLTYFASTEWLSENYENLVVIDTRTEKEFNGATDFGEARGGHIPGAVNLPFKELYNHDSTIKSQVDIEQVMEGIGITKDDTIVTYCTAGIRSAHMTLLLNMAGYENVKNYDASIYEWANNDTLPLD
ncbi:sulfurtransferase [Anaerobacillus alkalidiazotrophicus]|uniref:thiosulfate sulfurtransferase n=1 Tax=Anaerobacillus alkalidiazotrophicus TaxID=472963 RepID=A0A1S2M880_9BACI|nr:rhodanese-like domain-containing protein [Anaerobacillus alkalidiazotrophicus]OIJ20871.1 sulfurtransferase [Anaerobacillus alkalidiazotrophicus]